MTPIQQLMLGVGASKKTYLDDVFSIDLWKGNGTDNRAVTTGIDLASDGGLVWFKNRDATYNHGLIDTVRGAEKIIWSNTNSAQADDSTSLKSFTSTGFTLGTGNNVNGTTHPDHVGWSWKKTKGFFDVVTYTGNGSNRSLSHSLGCVPGLILIKRTDGTNDWQVYHRSVGNADKLALNTSDAKASTSAWNSTTPTSTVFHLGTAGTVNYDGFEYVAYLFAGGESTAATARSIDFDGNGDYLTIPTTSNMEFGTSDYTIDFWFKRNATGEMAIYDGTDGGASSTNRRQRIYVGTDGKIAYYDNWAKQSTSVLSVGTWNHVAVTRASGTSRIFINGTLEQSWDSSGNNHKKPDSDLYIGRYVDGSGEFNGSISNLRMIKSHAAYTSSFIPPTEPPTSTSDGAGGTDVKFLGCNDSSVTGAHINLLNTITSNGNPTASTDSPFDDPAGFVFGKNEDQNVIKCGSYVGDGSSTGPEIFLGNGWEPQWVMIKCTTEDQNWLIFDSMRGIVSGGNDNVLYPNVSNSEVTSVAWLEVTSTGFKITSTSGGINDPDDTYIYTCIRRPDGYCGKQYGAGEGTSVFAMDTGNSSTTQGFTSGFPVDFALSKKTSATSNWEVTARLIQEKYLLANSNNAEATFDKLTFDDNTGWNTHNAYDSVWQSFMFKRHAGFDVVTYTGDGVAGRQIPHSLNKTIEMMWVKKRNGSKDWICYHKGLNGGTNPEQYHLHLNTTATESQSINAWNNQAPTSTHFVVDDDNHVNGDDDKYMAFLFASVDGISKVGSYTGNGTTGQTITTGFAPRFVIIRRVNTTQYWTVLDTLRGWDGTNDVELYINETGTGNTVSTSNPTSNGFTLSSDAAGTNSNGDSYIYYCHA